MSWGAILFCILLALSVELVLWSQRSDEKERKRQIDEAVKKALEEKEDDQ